jgi:hypothetical protein
MKPETWRRGLNLVQELLATWLVAGDQCISATTLASKLPVSVPPAIIDQAWEKPEQAEQERNPRRTREHGLPFADRVAMSANHHVFVVDVNFSVP